MTEALINAFLNSGSISTDSRTIKGGEIFFAIRGDNYDGNRFAPNAIEKGAAIAVIDDAAYAVSNRYILVEDVLKSLQDLASHYRSRLSVPIVALTGTNGKTTTKELITRVLQKKYKVSSTKGNLNNHIGVPLSILSIPQDAEIAVLEMGANHIGEIDFLCRIARPTHGLITNIGKAHLEGFGSQEGVIKAKSELFRYISETHGTLFVNNDDELLMDLSKDKQRVTYGTSSKADIHAVIAAEDPFLQIKWDSPEGELHFTTSLYGIYNFQNILAAICTGQYFNVNAKDTADAIAGYIPENNRSQIVQTDNNLIFLDAYNANPSSMAQALNFFSMRKAKQKVIVLGDMLELGQESESEHRKVLDSVKGKFNKVILCGHIFTGFTGEFDYQFFQDTVVLKEWLQKHPLQNAEILIKGSRKIGLETLLPEL
ncbi:MAG: UDP-N-acetylmuramoyl-tripeptide--D-alanyl-D-alanine ligase [Bacteroidetes bacterium]|nr:UDP-N-acetylmuramoyl-tripeptide--D-alanyl-D-alanine ligase [Bacteroidota bacterium]